MIKNELISTNGIWYKIKKSFKSIFSKEKLYKKNETKIANNEQENSNLVYDDSLKEKFEKEQAKRVLAEKLLCGEIGTSELNETEVDEMTGYFTNDIQNIDNELLKIKKHILDMRQELKNIS